MCVIIVKKSDKNITRRELKECWDTNPDGAGFMYASNGALHVIKGFFAFRGFYRAFRRYEHFYPESDFVIHMRIATSGKRDYDNCHPFKVHNDLVFAHNGIFWGLGDKVHSDTYNLNEQIFKKFPKNFMDIPEIAQAVADYVGDSSSKVVFMDNTGRIIIINEKAGNWDKGIWYSSGHYKYIYTANCSHRAWNSGRQSSCGNATTAGCDEYDNFNKRIYHHAQRLADEVYCYSCNTWNNVKDLRSEGGYDYCPICGQWVNVEDNDYLWSRP